MSNRPEGLKIYIIRNKQTGEPWTAPSGKSSWKAVGHAKRAWATLCGYYGSAEYHAKRYGVELVPTGYNGRLIFPRFDEQNVYEIIDVNTEAGEMLTGLKDLIERLIKVAPEETKEDFTQQYEDLING